MSARPFVTVLLTSSALLAPLGCAKPLSELAPYPCAKDGTCPDGLACVPKVGCAPAQLDSPCIEGKTDCSTAGAGAVCFAGVCAPSCHDGAGCPNGRVCSAGSGAGTCVVDCTSGQSCPSGLECKDLWYSGVKGCASPGTTIAACASFQTETQCTFCGNDATLPVIQCPAFTCPAHGVCAETACNCEAGYTPTACDGTPCSQLGAGGCPAPNWWCKPDAPLSGSCTDAPSLVAGTCHCSDGTNLPYTCGTTLSCEERCATGCDSVLQDCPDPARPKCSVALDDSNVWSTLCQPQTGGVPEDAACTNGAGGLGDDDCAAGLFCVVYGVPATAPVCRRFCRDDAGCTRGSKCYAIDPLVPADGACVPVCRLFGDDCAPGLSCQPFLDIDRQTYFGFCRSVGEGAVGASCTSPLGCAVDTVCYPMSSRAMDRKCEALCDASHPCASGTCTGLPGLENGGGICR